MWPVDVVVLDELPKDCLAVPTANDQDPVQMLPADRAHEALGECIDPRRSDLAHRGNTEPRAASVVAMPL